MNRITSASLNYVCSLYVKCSKCETLYALSTLLVPSLSTNKYVANFYSISRQPSVKSNYINEVPERELIDDKTDSVGLKEKSKRKYTGSEELVFANSLNSIISYINSRKSLYDVKDLIITALKEKNEGLYLMDKETAKDLSDVFAPRLKMGSSLIIEVNPGLGFLTRELLQAGVSNIRLCESNKQFFEYLKNSLAPELSDIHHKDIIKFWKMQFIDAKDGGKRLAGALAEVNERDWEDEPVAKLVATIPAKLFIPTIINNIIKKNGLAKYGRPEFYLILDPLFYHALTNSGKTNYKNYTRLSVLFQVIFEYEILSKVPKKAFIPWGRERKKLSSHEKKILETVGDVMYVIRLTPRKDLYSNDFDKQLPVFNFFVKQLLYSCKMRIIPQLEQWVPGCGPNMIALGYDIYTEVGELTPQEILDVFLNFLSWDKGVGNSSFLASMDLYSLKKTDSDDVHEED